MSLMPLLPFFRWCDSSWVGTSIRGSSWIFPLLEVIHLLALTLLLGTIVAIDLRLLGMGMRRQPVSLVARNLAPFTRAGLGVMVASGSLLFCSEALKCFGNDGFRAKMILLFLALTFHFTIFRKVTGSEDDKRSPLLGGLVGLVSLMLWFGVGMAGRAIAFV